VFGRRVLIEPDIALQAHADLSARIERAFSDAHGANARNFAAEYSRGFLLLRAFFVGAVKIENEFDGLSHYKASLGKRAFSSRRDKPPRLVSTRRVLFNCKPMALLSLQNISLSHSTQPLLDGVSLQIEAGERVCLLGRNGAGKSTLLRLLDGEVAPDAGEIVIQKGARVARLPQEIPPDVSGTVYEVIESGGPSTPAHRIDALVSRLGLGLDASTPFTHLSGGLKRRAWLGRVLASEPDILLLDEPTNHLDLDAILWLEEFLLRSPQALLFVTHDRMFLRKLATRIVEIDRGQLLNWDCDYDTYLTRKAAALEVEEKQRALFDKRLAQEEAWIRRGVEARRTKSLSRIGALVRMREERQERRELIGSANLQLQDVRRSGRLIVEAEDVQFSYEGKKVIRDFSTLIMRGDKIGIIGPNGSGKTTLLKLLLGQLAPDAGSVQLGTRLEVAYFDQLRAALDENLTVQQNVCGDNSTVTFNGQQRHIVGYLQEFLFSPERARTPVSVLSGGERNRLLLAKLFTQPANLLVLDEPTNDLDAETLELLETLLVEFSGTALLVSHDRAFLNNVVGSTLVFEEERAGEYAIREYVGGYDDWLRQRVSNASTPAPKPQARKTPESRPRKMSFKEARELAALPARIEELENRQHTLAEQMAAPEFYQDDGSAVTQTTFQLAQLEREMAEAFTRWEELLELEKASGETRA
jgi:ATP-binding cassette subfamily F protein uup